MGLAEDGLYHLGTRHLSVLVLRIGGERPLLLGSTAKRDNSRLAVDLTNPDLRAHGQALERGTIHLSRTKVLCEGTLHERLVVRNFARSSAKVPLTIRFGADFVDIFEVRGMDRTRRGRRLPARLVEDGIELAYEGLDGVERRTRIAWTPKPETVTEQDAHFDLLLEPASAVTVEMRVSCSTDGDVVATASFDDALDAVSAELGRERRQAAFVSSSNEFFNDWIDRSIADLAMMTSNTPHGPYPYAGVPWFSTPFGRDGIITALQTLWLWPELARGVLGYLAANQATEHDSARDSDPGKILHELRHGEMAATGEIPFGRYYGSHDATPLFVLLAAAYYRRTADRGFIEQLWPSVEAALGWMDGPGDPDGDGFLEYERRTRYGLIQQGWKDSNDSIFHADGTLATGAIALCEIQGYAYAARLGAAEIAEAIDQGVRAEALRAQAERLRAAFEEAFWLDDLGTYAIALDGAKRPCRVRTSNPGHCLMTGIVSRERGERLGAELLSDASFSGWGIRTLTAGEPRYNPMSYHNGSIWPHDTAITAQGLARYGMHDHAAQLLTALFEASHHFDLARLPELFCGFSRRPGEGPTLYPVACSPQAWASGSVFMLLQASLGLEIDARASTLRFNHGRLPPIVDHLRVEGLRVGDASVDLYLERQRQGIGVNVLERSGEVEVIALR